MQVAGLLSLSSKCDRGRRKVTAEPLTVQGLKIFESIFNCLSVANVFIEQCRVSARQLC
jgi:hypothetical protein